MSSRELSTNLAGPSSTRNYGAINTNDPDVGFSPTELYSLGEDIGSRLYTISKNCKLLEKCYKTLGSQGDNQGFRNQIHVTQLSTNQLITATSKDLKRLTAIVKRSDKQQKLKVEKLTNSFSEAVQKYSDVQKKTAERMKQTLLVVVEEEMSGDQNGESTFEDRGKLLAQMQEVNKNLQFEQDLLVEREDRIKQIESDVIDINQVMRELGALVHEQTENIDSIENGIETTAQDLEQGTSELRKAAAYQQKYRRRVFIIFVICTILAAVLLWMLISSLKS